MRQRESFSTYTGIIIFVNVIAFLLFFVLARNLGFERVISLIALQPSSFLERPWTILTSMFMHSPSGLSHIFVNMISLMFLGGFVEKLIGKKRFLWLYLGSGLLAGLFFVVLSRLFGVIPLGEILIGSPTTIAVGASGAIFGLGGLLAVLTPRLPVLVFFILPMPMWIAMVFLMGVLWALSLSLGLPIGNTAHLGGLLVGLGYGFYLKKKYPHKTKMISKYFSR